ncbi:MAG: hypothetical protein KAJ40_06280 [Alphaproteobacteria bacterium]|nr:hypothetical protein [Alphaproteobacteria bacterium]
MTELKQIANDCKTDFLAMSALRSIVRGWLKMRPMQDISKKQKICDAVGISLKTPRLTDNKHQAKK